MVSYIRQGSTNDAFQNVELAMSCLETGIGIEAWALHKVWPDVCVEVQRFASQHPDTVHPATIASINTMLAGDDNGNRKFDCPVFVAESRHGWPRSCNNVKSSGMAELRRHLTERAGRGYGPQLAFLELCTSCNEDFLDKDEFETRHGYKGELCTTRRPQRRWPHSRVQWELLYRKVEALMAVQRLSSRKHALAPDRKSSTHMTILERVDLDPTVPQPTPTPHNLYSYDPIGDPEIGPSDRHPDPIAPYQTPYQLIVDSESEEGDIATSPRLVSL